VADGTLLDYETTTSHNITVKAADPSGMFTTQTFTINVTDVRPRRRPMATPRPTPSRKAPPTARLSRGWRFHPPTSMAEPSPTR